MTTVGDRRLGGGLFDEGMLLLAVSALAVVTSLPKRFEPMRLHDEIIGSMRTGDALPPPE